VPHAGQVGRGIKTNRHFPKPTLPNRNKEMATEVIVDDLMELKQKQLSI